MNQRTAKTLSGLVLIGCFLLTACNNGGNSGSQSSSSSSSSPEGRPRAKKGEFCGGIAGFLCEKGLTCQYEGTYPDAGGTCVEE